MKIDYINQIIPIYMCFYLSFQIKLTNFQNTNKKNCDANVKYQWNQQWKKISIKLMLITSNSHIFKFKNNIIY